MKLIIPFILSILLLSGCATTQQQVQKPLCPEGQLPAICIYCKTELCVSPPVDVKTQIEQLWRNINTPNPNTFICPVCKKENKAELSVQGYIWKKEREEGEKIKLCATCNKCNRRWSFTKADYDSWVDTDKLLEATAKITGKKIKTTLPPCPYCGAEIDDLDRAIARCQYDETQETMEFQKMLLLQKASKPEPQKIIIQQDGSPKQCFTNCDKWGNCYTSCN